MNDVSVDSIIELIRRNRISSVEVADAMDKTGVLNGLNIYNPLHFVVGRVHYVCTYDESNWPLHEQISDLPDDCVLFVDAINCADRAVFGDIVSKYLMLYKRVQGMIINGFLRDAHRLRKENYPIWLKGVTPKGCFNRNVTPSEQTARLISERKEMFHNNIAVCDDSGVTLIKEENINQKLHDRLEFIELQEDIWYFCIDTLKWSTFDTICKKKYLDNPDILPLNIREKLNHNTNKKA